MARNMYGATSADFTLTSGGRVVPGATLTIWSARTGGTQITDLLDVDSVATTTVTSGADGSVVYYGPNNDKTVHWADSGQGARVAIRPVDITGDPPVLSIGTVGTGAAAASLTGTSEAPVLNLTLPSAGTNGVNTAAIQDGAVTPVKMATSGRFTFPTGAANGYGFTSGASHLSGTGSPEGVVTAAPGSSWLQTDSTVTASGWLRWIKATGTGNTGWVAGPEADTGFRNMTASLINGWTATSVQLRRVGSQVWLQLRGLNGSAASSDSFLAIPTGFGRNPMSVALYLPIGASANPTTFTYIGLSATEYVAPRAVVTGAQGYVTWTNGDSWPTVLPGS